MRYLLCTSTRYEHIAKKFERAGLIHVGQDGSKMAVYVRSFLFLNTF